MTPEDFDRQIEQILAIQRDLQEGQLKLQEGHLKLQEEQRKLQEEQQMLKTLQAENSVQIRSLVSVAQIQHEEAKVFLQVQRQQSEDISVLKQAVDYLIRREGG